MSNFNQNRQEITDREVIPSPDMPWKGIGIAAFALIIAAGIAAGYALQAIGLTLLAIFLVVVSD